jgi:hypothetical protein
MKFIHYIIICLAFIIVGCSPSLGPDIDENGMIHIKYTESDADFPNPERGWIVNNYFHSADASPFKLNSMEMHRRLNRTVLLVLYYLTDFMESDISQEYLDLIQENFKILRKGGMKCVLRFAYKDDMYETGHPWDASPEWVHRHIEQLKPLMQQNSDVILCLQAGFIGVWGEWAYTDHFVSGPQSVADHSLRKEVMMALLDAMPQDRQIALRTPMFKRKMFLYSYQDTLTFETAHSGSIASRICGHNDCFGATENDMGTFTENGSRDLWKKDTRFVLMGGETCQVYDYCKCEGSQKDLEDYHWTYLNVGGRGIAQWKQQGCLETITKRLGYRLSLTKASFTSRPKAGKEFDIFLHIKNSGYASPMNPRDFEFVLMDSEGNRHIYRYDDIDPRFWMAGETTVISRTITLPEDAEGEYTLYLNLPDGRASLRNNPRYSIRLANDDIWDEQTGYNIITKFKL